MMYRDTKPAVSDTNTLSDTKPRGASLGHLFTFEVSVFLLYWYKSTHTDTLTSSLSVILQSGALSHVCVLYCYTCFTGTTVQMLTSEQNTVSSYKGAHCHVYELEQVQPGKSEVYLLYWYKSANTNANAPGPPSGWVRAVSVSSLRPLA